MSLLPIMFVGQLLSETQCGVLLYLHPMRWASVLKSESVGGSGTTSAGWNKCRPNDLGSSWLPGFPPSFLFFCSKQKCIVASQFAYLMFSNLKLEPDNLRFFF